MVGWGESGVRWLVGGRAFLSIAIIMSGWFCGYRFSRSLSCVAASLKYTLLHSRPYLNVCPEEEAFAASFSIIHTLSDWRNECSLGRGRQSLQLVVSLALIVLVEVEVLVLVVLLGVGVGRLLLSLLLLLVLLLLHLLLPLFRHRPCLLSDLLGVLGVVGDEDVVEDGAALDLPEVKADGAELLVLADLLDVVGVVLWVGDHGVDPLALVVGVVDLPGLPLALEVGVVDHGGLPLAVHLVVPVLGLGGIGVGHVLRLVPVLGLGRLRVLDLLGREEVPVVLEGAGLDLLVVDEHLVLSVGLHDERVEVGVDVVLAAHLLLGQQVLALVVEDDVHLLGAGAADVGAEHHVVRAVAVHISLVEGAVEELDVSAAAVDVLLVLDGELHDERLLLVGEGLLELGAGSVELGVLRRLDALVLLGVAVKLARRQLELAGVGALVRRVYPSLRPLVSILEPLLEVDLGGDGRDDRGEHDQQPHPFRNRRRWGRS